MSERPPLPPRPDPEGSPDRPPLPRAEKPNPSGSSGQGAASGRPRPPRPRKPARKKGAPARTPGQGSKEGAASASGRPGEHQLPTLDWRKALIASQVWWIKASGRKKAGVLAIGFLLLFLVMRLMGCTSTASEMNKRRVAEGGPSADLLQKAQEAVSGSKRIASSTPVLSLNVSYNQGVLAIDAADSDTVVLSDGKRLRYNGRCWEDNGSTARPRAMQVVLPLEEPSASFTDYEVIENRKFMSFTAERLGSWGPGSGEVVLDENDRPLRYSYALDGSSQEYVFNITYPDKLPELNLKRCRS